MGPYSPPQTSPETPARGQLDSWVSELLRYVDDTGPAPRRFALPEGVRLLWSTIVPAELGLDEHRTELAWRHAVGTGLLHPVHCPSIRHPFLVAFRRGSPRRGHAQPPLPVPSFALASGVCRSGAVRVELDTPLLRALARPRWGTWLFEGLSAHLADELRLIGTLGSWLERDGLVVDWYPEVDMGRRGPSEAGVRRVAQEWLRLRLLCADPPAD